MVNPIATNGHTAFSSQMRSSDDSEKATIKSALIQGVMRWLIILLALMAFQPACAANGTATASGSASATVVDAVTFAHDAGATFSIAQTRAGAVGAVKLTGDGFTLRGSSDHLFSVITSGGSLTSADGASIQLETSAKQNSSADQVGVKVGGTLALNGHEKAGTYCGSYLTLVSYD